ncbi:hypothetical protein LSTR_LSTR006664 [Laodelphax striatellus]|uniref:Threonylcarbamoyl-AMP synthase n=1 Tax=Laodelphax striatellus TaxID=195883 RepID=A0A482X9U4_LAOST|nr:hypothetical protein LSTR_LSTR006664 [Laodelphax striatellus]
MGLAIKLTELQKKASKRIEELRSKLYLHLNSSSPDSTTTWSSDKLELAIFEIDDYDIRLPIVKELSLSVARSLSKESEHVQLALRLLSKGELIAIPTDTVYALACDCDNNVAKLYSLTGNDRRKPLSICVGCRTVCSYKLRGTRLVE